MSTIYTIDDIRGLRKAKKQEINKSADKIRSIGAALFAPQKSSSNLEGIMQHVNAGIAAYDGLMTGLKLMRRVQSFFRKNKKK